jgi:hypothetical protein
MSSPEKIPQAKIDDALATADEGRRLLGERVNANADFYAFILADAYRQVKADLDELKAQLRDEAFERDLSE